MGYTVFLSHFSEDKEWVEQIAQKLLCENIKPYLFERDPQPGESICEKIQNAISDSDAFVVLVTKEGQASKWLNAEIGYAKAVEIPIIPLVDSRIKNPELPFIGDTEYIRVDLEKFENELPILIKDLSKRKFKKHLLFLTIAGGLLYLYFRGKNKIIDS